MRIVEEENYAYLYPAGYLNGPTGEAIQEACGDLIRNGADRIVINFQEIETINTMGIAGLVGLLEKTGAHDGVVCFSNLLSANRQMLDVLDISRAVLIFETEQEARTHLENLE